MSKILIVDDEPEILDFLSEILRSKVLADVDKASNGLDAFIKCQKEEYDLIITDHKMPFMVGAAFVVGVRTKENKNKQTPIIFLSAHISDELRKSLNISAISFLEKPIDTKVLIETVRDLAF